MAASSKTRHQSLDAAAARLDLERLELGEQVGAVVAPVAAPVATAETDAPEPLFERVELFVEQDLAAGPAVPHG